MKEKHRHEIYNVLNVSVHFWKHMDWWSQELIIECISTHSIFLTNGKCKAFVKINKRVSMSKKNQRALQSILEQRWEWLSYELSIFQKENLPIPKKHLTKTERQTHTRNVLRLYLFKRVGKINWWKIWNVYKFMRKSLRLLSNITERG